MTELFISYSRRNKTFTENLIKALNENDYPADKIWVDWQDIPPSSKWEDEIRKGIESANSVIFILSPDWVSSAECIKELKVAAEYNKRLFPIVCQDVDPRTCPPELASLNWIFFRAADNFNEALRKLIEAVNTDLNWVAQHTLLLKQADEWAAKKRDRSYLLRGSELQEAEAWLAQAAESKQPKPTALQREYIFNSRKDDVRRQRNTLIGVSVALVVSIMLAIAAVISGFEANHQSQRALANQLAAQSINYADDQPDLALLLSLEANYIGDKLGESSPEWLGSLENSLNNSPKLYTYLRAHTEDVRTVTFSPDGHWLVSAGGTGDGSSGEIILWNMDSKQVAMSSRKFTGNTRRLLSVAFSPDGKKFAAVGDDGKIFVWDPQHCCKPIYAWDLKSKSRALTFVRVAGHEYVAAAMGANVTFWDISNGKMKISLTLQIPVEDKSARILSMAVSPQFDTLAVGSDDGNITVWDLQTQRIKFHRCSYQFPGANDASICKLVNTDSPTEIRGLAFNATGDLLVSTSSDRHTWLWDVKTGQVLARTGDDNEGGHVSTVSSAAFNPKTNQLATVSWDNTVRLWSIAHDATWHLDLIDSLAGHSNSVWTTAYSPDGNWLATGSSDKTIILWKISQVSQIGTPIAQMDGEVWALAAAPDGKQFSAADQAGNIRTWNVDGNTLRDAKAWLHRGGVLTLAYSHDGRWLASAGYDMAIRVWDAKTGREAWHVEGAHTDQIWSLMFSPDDHQLASASFDQTVKLWDTATHKQIGAALKHDQGVFMLAFNNDGSQLFVAGYSQDIFQWDLKNPAKPVRLPGHFAAVNSIAYNQKFPPLMASSSDDKTLLIWNVAKREHTPQVLGLNESMEAVAFRPSGDWLASATNSATILLWQLDAKRCSENWNKDTCQPAYIGVPLNGHAAAVNNIVFLSDTDLISSGDDGQLIQWNLDKRIWYQRACEIVNRSFDKVEYSRYVEGKINMRLLNTFSWLFGLFDARAPEHVPPCIIQ